MSNHGKGTRAVTEAVERGRARGWYLVAREVGTRGGAVSVVPGAPGGGCDMAFLHPGPCGGLVLVEVTDYHHASARRKRMEAMIAWMDGGFWGSHEAWPQFLVWAYRDARGRRREWREWEWDGTGWEGP